MPGAHAAAARLSTSSSWTALSTIRGYLSDLPSLVRYHYENLDENEQAAMKRVYGGMLTALLEYAGVPEGRQQ